MNTAYVYTLTDPRNGMPFYVGKGVGRRCHFHAWEAKNSDKLTYKLNKIRKIQNLGLDIVVSKVEENVSHEQAKELDSEQKEHVLSRMVGKLPGRLRKEKLTEFEAIAIQLELEDEQLQEWRLKFAAIKEKANKKPKA